MFCRFLRAFLMVLCTVQVDAGETRVLGIGSATIDYVIQVDDQFLVDHVVGEKGYPLELCARLGNLLDSHIVEVTGAVLPEQTWEKVRSFIQLETADERLPNRTCCACNQHSHVSSPCLGL